MSYSKLVSDLRGGAAVPVAEVKATCEAAGKTLGDLVEELHGPGRPPRPGDRCPRCGRGRLRVGTTRRRGDRLTRYLQCRACGQTAGKIVCSDLSERGADGPRRGH